MKIHRLLAIVAAFASIAANDLALAGPALRNDFDGDGKADILWNHRGDSNNPGLGLVHRMSLDGLSIVRSESVYREPNLAWKPVARGDFDANGVTDLVWRNASTGEVYVQLFGPEGRPIDGRVVHVEPDPAWRLVGAVDVDGDGRADLVWHKESGAAAGKIHVMAMDGTQVRWAFDGIDSVAGYGRVVAVEKPGVFGGSGLLMREDTGAGRVWSISIGGVAYADFRGNVVSMTTPTQLYAEPDQDWRIVACVDLDGDGRGDILWQHAATGAIYGMLTRFTSAGYTPDQDYIHFPDTAAWKVADTGDYDGDGKVDILWHNEVDGRVHVMLMNGLDIKDQRTIYQEPDTRWKPIGPRAFDAP